MIFGKKNETAKLIENLSKTEAYNKLPDDVRKEFNLILSREKRTLEESVKFKAVYAMFALYENDKLLVDFSNESIKEIEKKCAFVYKKNKELLEKSAEADRKNIEERTSKKIEQMTVLYGAYIAYVMIRNLKDVKFDIDSSSGVPILVVNYRNKAYYVENWCHKRMLYGENDNIWLKYENVVLNDF